MSKEMMQIIFTPDHKEVWRYRDGPDKVVAKWHLEGDDLVFILETQSEAGPPGTTSREKIKKITSEELVITDGTTDGQWKRGPMKRSSSNHAMARTAGASWLPSLRPLRRLESLSR
jgi:hypothetical protein